ncbi:MAG: hypothetical protein O3C17_07600 [Planctomycetota bacterium]|nr:hypothetical protein [Planctomycetota bacterium]
MAGSEPQKVGLESVQKLELEAIADRRQQVGIQSPTGQPGDIKDTMGLALSGGGVRSASFNLGLLQSFRRFGILRLVDYLSTVSGGGYVGGYLSSLTLRDDAKQIFGGGNRVNETTPETKDDSSQPAAATLKKTQARQAPVKKTQAKQTPAKKIQAKQTTGEQSADRKESEQQDEVSSVANGKNNRINADPGSILNPDTGDQQPREIRRLIMRGNSMIRPLLFLNRLLIGMFLINVVVFSGLIAACALIAVLFRCLDLSWTMTWLGALGFQDDLTRAFFPTFVLLVFWALAWALAYWRDRAPARGKGALILLVPLLASVPIAITALLGTGDVDLSRIFKLFAIEKTESVNEVLNAIDRYAVLLFVGAVVIGLIPMLKPRLLIESGRQSSGTLERTTYWITSRALLIGLPLLVFGFIAGENISRFNDERGDLRTADIGDVEAFWQRVNKDANTFVNEVEAAPETEIGARIWWVALHPGRPEVARTLRTLVANHTNPALREVASAELLAIVHRPADLNAQATEISDRLWFPERWLHLLASMISGDDDDSVSEIVRLRNHARALGDGLYRSVTEGVLAQHDFYQLITPPAKPGTQADATAKSIEANSAERFKRTRDRLVKAQSLNIVLTD